MLLIVLALTMLTTACQTTSSNVAIPPLIEYSPEQQQQALKERKLLGPPCPPKEVVDGCSMLRTFVNDYKWMRDKIRAADRK